VNVILSILGGFIFTIMMLALGASPPVAVSLGMIGFAVLALISDD